LLDAKPALEGKIETMPLLSWFELHFPGVPKIVLRPTPDYVFPEPLPPQDFLFHVFNRPEGYVLVEWKKNNAN
jgi:hypothetical protein